MKESKSLFVKQCLTHQDNLMLSFLQICKYKVRIIRYKISLVQSSIICIMAVFNLHPKTKMRISPLKDTILF